MSNRGYKINFFKTKLLIFLPKFLCLKFSPSQFRVTLSFYLLKMITLESCLIPLSHPHLMGQKVISAMPSKYIKNPATSYHLPCPHSGLGHHSFSFEFLTSLFGSPLTLLQFILSISASSLFNLPPPHLEFSVCFLRAGPHCPHCSYLNVPNLFLAENLCIFSSPLIAPACNAGVPGLIPELGRVPGKGVGYPLQYSWASLAAQLVKNPPAMQETWV